MKFIALNYSYMNFEHYQSLLCHRIFNVIRERGIFTRFFHPMWYQHPHIYTTCVSFDTIKASIAYRLEIARHQVSLCICIYLHVEFVMLTKINLRKTKNGSLVYLSLHFLKIFQVYYSFFGAPIHIRFGWTNHYIKVPRFYLSSFLHVDMTIPPNQ